MKKRILAIGEWIYLNTGYGVYWREVLSRLYHTDKYEIAMLANYIDREHSSIRQCPWKVYVNQPSRNDSQEIHNSYNSDIFNQFGKFIWPKVFLDFRPDITLLQSDFWMSSFVFESPFRRYTNVCWLNPVDAYPQKDDWMDKTLDCDGILTYNDWSKDVINKQCGKTVCKTSAPPCADEAFIPIPNRREIKKQFGLGDAKIIGMVARNQGRKCIPELFEAFKQLVDSVDQKLYLYLSTSYPDNNGFDIPKYLLEYELSSKVLFTYHCRNCKYTFPSLFSEALCFCPKCKQLSAGLSNVKDGASTQELAFIYNLFDIFVLWSVAEGFGIPAVEAASCGIPIIGVDYSAPSDIVRKLGGILIKPSGHRVDVDTGRYFATMNNSELVNTLRFLLNLSEEELDRFGQVCRENYLKHYSWDKTAKFWEDYVDSVDVSITRQRCKEPPQIRPLPSQIPQGMDNQNFVRWLILEVLGDPSKLGTYLEVRTLRDLNYGVTTGGLGGKYYNEFSALFGRVNHQEFNRETAFKHFCSLREEINKYEQQRAS